MNAIDPAFTALSSSTAWPEQALGPLIANADATLAAWAAGCCVLPVIVPEHPSRVAESERCWVTCLESATIGYAVDEWQTLNTPSALAVQAVRALAVAVRSGPWRRAVQAGSLPFSTTLRTAADESALWTSLDALRARYADRPLAVRHVWPDSAPHWPQDAIWLPARVIYRFDAREGQTPDASHFKRDLGLLRKAGLTLLEDGDFDTGRVDEALALYARVYRDRHSMRNPDYRAGFIALARARGWLRLLGLADPHTGRLLAFAGEHTAGEVLSVPMLGHDTTADAKAGLYRQLVAALIRRAAERRQRFDFSSGAGDFKRKRGFVPVLEGTLWMPPRRGWRRLPDHAWLALAGRIGKQASLDRLLAAGA